MFGHEVEVKNVFGRRPDGLVGNANVHTVQAALNAFLVAFKQLKESFWVIGCLIGLLLCFSVCLSVCRLVGLSITLIFPFSFKNYERTKGS